MGEPKYAFYNDFSGVVIKGDIKYRASATPGHFDRAFYVTSAVETGAAVGSVQSYDGCAMTCGLHQAILVYPKELGQEDFNPGDDIGPLAELLVRISKLPSFPARDALANAFAEEGWALGSDAKFRYTRARTFPLAGKQVSVKVGDLVYGAEIRNTLTPINGKVPSKGKYWDQAVKWAQLFHAVFSNPITFQTQVDFGIEHMLTRCRTLKLNNGKTVLAHIYGNNLEKDPFFTCPDLDLAMCVYHSHSVNAPAIALQKLNQAIDQTKFAGYNNTTLAQKVDLARELLHLLGTSTYGKWNFSEPNGRWQRTRTICQTTGWWNNKSFASIMPSSF